MELWRTVGTRIWNWTRPIGLKFVTRCLTRFNKMFRWGHSPPFLFRFSGMFAWSSRVAVFELFFVMCFLSRFPPNDHVYSCVLAMNCYDLFHVLGQQIHNSTHPSGLDPARPDVCRRRIRWSLDRFGLTAASLVAEKLIRRLSLDSDSCRRWSGEAKALTESLNQFLSQVSDSSPWNSQLTQGLKCVR